MTVRDIKNDKREIWIKCENDNKEYIVTELVPFGYEDLVDHRIFPNHTDMQYMMLTLGKSKWAYQHGLGCPADAKNVIKKIESMQKY